jgi:predicted nuclease of predicted toxin-antitoxin system
MLNFLVDEQLSPSLAKWILVQGIAAQHVTEVGLGQCDDSKIVAFATLEQRVVVSKDSDYLWLHAHDPQAFQLIILNWGNQSVKELLRDWARVWPVVVTALAAGDRRIILRP